MKIKSFAYLPTLFFSMNFSGNTDNFFHWPEQQLELPLVTCCKATSFTFVSYSSVNLYL